MNSIFLKYIGFLLLMFVFEIQAQNFQLTNYSLRDGVPQSQVNVTIQDEIGFLWFGTEGGGICRFDGRNFDVWDRSTGLQSNYINDLKWIDGRLYIATDKGVSIKEHNTFINYETNEVYKITNSENKVFLATQTGVQVFDGKSITRFGLNEVVNDVQYNEGFVWVATDTGLYRIDVNNKSRNKIEPIVKGIFASVSFLNQKIYGVKKSGGLFMYDEDANLLDSIYEKEKILSLSVVNNDLWAAVYNKGLLEISSKTLNVVKRYNETSGIPSNEVLNVFQDSQQNKWIATTNNGVFKLKVHQFRHLFKNSIILSTLATNEAIWFGTQNELIKINADGVEKESIGTPITSISKFDKYTLTSTSQGLLVLDSLQVVDTINKQDGLVSNVIKKALTNKDEIWVAYKNKGISSLSYNTKTKTIYNLIHFNKTDGLYDERIKDFAIDKNDRLWYVSEKGFFGSIKNRKLRHLGNQLPFSIKIEILVIHDNKLFVATDADGIWMSPVSDKLNFTNVTKGSRLNSKRIHQLLFDAQNNLWAGTSKGVYRIEFEENYKMKSEYHFGYDQGFKGLETTPGSTFMDKFNNLYFGTKSGLMTYQSAGFSKTKTKLPIAYTSIEVVYNSIDTINLKHWTNSAKVLNLKPKENHISFSYTSVDINSPDNILYRWKINSNTWSSWSKKSVISFANLNAGDYVFEVVSKSINDQISGPIEFKFSIDQKLVDKIWVRISVLGLLLLIIIFISWNSIRKIRRKASEKNEKLKLENDLLTLKHKALQLQMNPHFIFNVLNSIKAMSRLDIDKMHTTLNNFALLLRSTLNNSRKEQISLIDEITNLKNYISIEQLMRTSPFEFSIKTEVSVDLEEVMIPTMLVQPFVENAIKHGFGSSSINAQLEINFIQQKEILLVEIRDNGIGYFTTRNKVISVSHESVAVELSKERITNLAGRNTLKIEELRNDQSELIGTRVQFSIPFITDY